ncbi:MAG: HAMP domain-containing histidine kinase, partial [Candidatus Eremiobacteraeota bacterium]|nr:HAMP domain-containing histidine kinase [Candidatus Eremiobacteraeota bacterium]
MRTAFGRRLLVVTALEMAAVLCTIVFVAALVAFGAYLGAVRGEVQSTLDRVAVAMDSSQARSDARVAGTMAASRYPRQSVVVLLVDTDRRVNVFQPYDGAQPVVNVRRRGDPSGEPHAGGAFARVVLGVATAFGLQPARRHIGKIDVIVHANETSLVGTAASYLPELLVALVLALAIAFALARQLTRQVLRPLVDVTRALERFASGDLTPQTIAADRREQLASLALAYNGAIAQMERAFAERDRANATMRQFIADAGHQLRTPLTVVRGFIAILRKGDLRTPEDRERILETMNRQSQIMGSLIERLMLLERWEDERDRASAESIDVAQLVGDVVAPIAESNPARTVNVSVPDVGLAAIDPMELGYAVTNLIDNALKYTPGAIDVGVRREPGSIVVEIADRGPGMSAADVRHAFDRFFRGAR